MMYTETPRQRAFVPGNKEQRRGEGVLIEWGAEHPSADRGKSQGDRTLLRSVADIIRYNSSQAPFFGTHGRVSNAVGSYKRMPEEEMRLKRGEVKKI